MASPAPVLLWYSGVLAVGAAYFAGVGEVVMAWLYVAGAAFLALCAPVCRIAEHRLARFEERLEREIMDDICAAIPECSTKSGGR